MEQDPDTVGGPDDPRDHVQIVEACRAAGELVAEGRPAAAVALLQRAAAANPMAGDIWQHLGAALVRAGRFDLTALAYRRAASFAPRDARPLLAAATAFYALGRLDDAQRDGEAARAIALEKPGNGIIVAGELLAKIAVARKEFDRARSYAADEKLAGTSVSVPLAEFIEGLVAYARGRNEEALAHFEAVNAAVGSSSSLTETHYYAAETLARLERWDEAVAEYNEELERFPFNLQARANLALAHHAAGNPEEAEQVLSALLKVAPTPEGYGKAARIWGAMGDARRAKATRVEARRLFPGDPGLKMLGQAAAR